MGSSLTFTNENNIPLKASSLPTNPTGQNNNDKTRKKTMKTDMKMGFRKKNTQKKTYREVCHR